MRRAVDGRRARSGRSSQSSSGSTAVYPRSLPSSIRDLRTVRPLHCLQGTLLLGKGVRLCPAFVVRDNQVPHHRRSGQSRFCSVAHQPYALAQVCVARGFGPVCRQQQYWMLFKPRVRHLQAQRQLQSWKLGGSCRRGSRQQTGGPLPRQAFRGPRACDWRQRSHGGR